MFPDIRDGQHRRSKGQQHNLTDTSIKHKSTDLKWKVVTACVTTQTLFKIESDEKRVAGTIKFHLGLQKMSVKFSQYRPRCLKCDLHKVQEHKHRDVNYIKDFYRATKPF